MYKANTRIPVGTENVRYCPIGYSPAFENGLPVVEEDMDVYFYGSLTPRRKDVIMKLRENNIDIHDHTNIYGIQRDQYIMRSKIIMNIKASDM